MTSGVAGSTPSAMGFCPLPSLAPRHIKRLINLKVAAGLPGAANNRKKYLGSMFAWAINDADPPLLQGANPARDVRKVKYATDGFHTWTEAEFAQFEARHPLGTKAYLALALLLYTEL